MGRSTGGSRFTAWQALRQLRARASVAYERIRPSASLKRLHRQRLLLEDDPPHPRMEVLWSHCSTHVPKHYRLAGITWLGPSAIDGMGTLYPEDDTRSGLNIDRAINNHINNDVHVEGRASSLTSLPGVDLISNLWSTIDESHEVGSDMAQLTMRLDWLDEQFQLVEEIKADMNRQTEALQDVQLEIQRQRQTCRRQLEVLSRPQDCATGKASSVSEVRDGENGSLIVEDGMQNSTEQCIR